MPFWTRRTHPEWPSPCLPCGSVHTLIVVVCIAMLVPLAHYALTGNGGRWAVLALLPPLGILIGILPVSYTHLTLPTKA